MRLVTHFCDVCHEPLRERQRQMEIRSVFIMREIDGRTPESDHRAEVCSPACALTADWAAIQRAWGEEAGAIAIDEESGRPVGWPRRRTA